MSSKEIRDKASATLLAHYGVEHVADIPGMSDIDQMTILSLVTIIFRSVVCISS